MNRTKRLRHKITQEWLCNKPGFNEAYGDEEKQTQIFSFNNCIGKRNMKSDEKLKVNLREKV